MVNDIFSIGVGKPCPCCCHPVCWIFDAGILLATVSWYVVEEAVVDLSGQEYNGSMHYTALDIHHHSATCGGTFGRIFHTSSVLRQASLTCIHFMLVHQSCQLYVLAFAAADVLVVVVAPAAPVKGGNLSRGHCVPVFWAPNHRCAQTKVSILPWLELSWSCFVVVFPAGSGFSSQSGQGVVLGDIFSSQPSSGNSLFQLLHCVLLLFLLHQQTVVKYGWFILLCLT